MARRIAVVAAIILLVALVALPPVFGARARSLLEPRLNAIGDSLGPGFALVVSFDEWDAGWFSSTATVTLDAEVRAQGGVAAVAPGFAESYQTTLPGTITVHHGPLITGSLWCVGWGNAEFVVDATTIPDLQEFQAETGVEQIARLTALVGFLGETTIGLTMPSFQTTGGADSSEEIRFAGLDATVGISQDGNRADTAGTLHGFSVATSGVPAFEIGRVDWAGRVHTESAVPDLWLGDGSADLGPRLRHRAMTSRADSR